MPRFSFLIGIFDSDADLTFGSKYPEVYSTNPTIHAKFSFIHSLSEFICHEQKKLIPYAVKTD